MLLCVPTCMFEGFLCACMCKYLRLRAFAGVVVCVCALVCVFLHSVCVWMCVF